MITSSLDPSKTNGSDNIFNQDGTDTGYRFVMTYGIRGLYNGEPIRIIGGTIPISDAAKESGMGIYKILYKPVK